ncbi:MAG: type VI secretion system tube protein Hcp [Bacteroidota bacterium]
MKSLFLLLCFAAMAFCADSQGVKMIITGVTAAEGEDVIAFETSDTIAATNFSGGGGASTPVFEFVKIKKVKGVSTNELYKRSLSGLHLTEVKFEFYDEIATLFYQVSIKDVTVNHFSYLAPECPGCFKLFHQVWFDYKQIEVTDISTGLVVRYNRATRVFY